MTEADGGPREGHDPSVGCIFCRLLADPALVTRHRSRRVAAFDDQEPQAPIHVLIVPIDHTPAVSAITDPSLLAEMFAVATRLASDLGLGVSGYRMVFNTGPDAGQSVFHTHMHLVGGAPLGGSFGAGKAAHPPTTSGGFTEMTTAPRIPVDPTELTDPNWPDLKAVYDHLAESPLPDASAVTEWLVQWSAFEDVVAEARNRANFAYTCNTTDEAREAVHLRWATEIEPVAQEQRVRLGRRLLESGYSEAGLTAALRSIGTDVALHREENVPLLADLQRLSAEYQKITGSLTAPWDGDNLPLPRLKPFMQSPDRSVRERAWRAQRAPYVAQHDVLADLFSRQRRLRETVAHNAGFANYRDFMHESLHRFDYTPADCATFHQAIERAAVPAAERILARRRQRLGLATLRPWDVEADPEPEPLRPFTDGSDLVDRAIATFDRLDPELGTRFRLMRDEGLLDLESRAGKAPGGYCDELPHRRRPLIFMNAAGVPEDLVTLVHEAGHSFHAFEMFERNLRFLERWPGMEFAELASMGMEFLSAPYWGKDGGGFYSDHDHRRARVRHLESTILGLPHIATVDAFQQWVYTDPAGADARARDEKWLELRRRFEVGIDYTGLEAEWVARWYMQLHIFEVPFYYVEYGLAQLGALQLWMRSLDNESEAVAGYRRALALGATRPLPELFAAAGLTFAFDADTVARLVDRVEAELARLEEV